MPETAIAEAPASTEAAESSSPKLHISNPTALIERMMEEGRSNQPDDATSSEPTESTPPKPVATPEKAAPDADAFVPPEILMGGEPAQPAQKPEGVAELMPEEPPGAIKTEKGKAEYRKWRAHQLSLETKLKEFEGRLAAVPSSTDADARVKQMEQRLLEMSSVTERANLELHPAFQQQFVQPRNHMIGTAMQSLETVGADPVAFEKMLGLYGKARIDAMDDLMDSIQSPTIKNQIGQIIFGIENLDAQRAQVMADVRGNNERLKMQESALRHQRMEQQEKQTLATMGDVIEELQTKSGFEFLREIPGNETWNQGVRQSIEQAAYILNKSDNPAEVITAAVLATQAPRYMKAYKAEAAKRMALEAELKELKSSEPGIGGGGRVGEGKQEEDRGHLGNIFERASRGSGPFGN